MQNKEPIYEITIHIGESGNDKGFFYDIYRGSPEDSSDEEAQSIEGGFCSSINIAQAIGMASSAAIAVTRSNRGHQTQPNKEFIICPMCGYNAYRKEEAQAKNTPIWSCEECPFIGFKYIDHRDTENVKNTLQ